MSTVIVTVVVTLGIIIAGGFLIYFLGDLFMSLASHGKKDDEAIKGKSKRDKQKVQSVLAEKYPEDAEKIENDADMMKRNINVLKRRLKNIVESQLEIIDDMDKLDI